MQFIDLETQQRRIRTDIEARIRNVLNHGQYIMGPEVQELEEKLAEYAGMAHCIGCSSGTDALLMALMALDVKPGDVVITSPFTFVATAEAICLAGAIPVFADIDPHTFNISPTEIERAIQAVMGKQPSVHALPRILQDSEAVPKGIIAVDLFGLPADYDAIKAIAKKYGLFVIADAAQSFGADYKGKKACSAADISCTSFFPAKPLGAYGDAGAVFTADDGLAGKLHSIRIHGQGLDKYHNDRIGLNARLDTLQAAILLSKFHIFPDEILARQRVAGRYGRGLQGLPMVNCPEVPENYKSVWAQYSVRSGQRLAIRNRLADNGIPTAVYYQKPLHLQNAFSHLGYSPGDMPVSEAVSNDIFSLPMHPYLDDEQIDRICGIIGEAL
ncbi:MAG: DegT/DnrJ/EryC1/StrS family aminotransferase [Thermodesulfobacteriota bacterium]